MANRLTRAFRELTSKGVSQIGEQSIRAFNNFVLRKDYFGVSTSARTQKQYAEWYSNHPLVFMVVNKIVSSSSGIKRVAVDDNGEEIDTNEIYELLNNPNSKQDSIEFLEDIAANFEATGNAYIWLKEGIGLGQELIVLKSANVEPQLNNLETQVLSYLYNDINGNEYPIPADEVLHIKESNITDETGVDAFYGISKLQAAASVVISSKEKFGASASIFKNRGIIGILTSSKDTPMLPKERERLQKEFDSEVGGSDKYNKIKISTSQLQYIQTGMSPTDLKLLEGILSDMRIIAGIYGLSSVLFNDTASSTYNNMETAVRDSYNDVYIPLANKIDSKLSQWLRKKLNTTGGVKIDLTSIEALDANTSEVAKALKNFDSSVARDILGSMTADEQRELIGLEPATPEQQQEINSRNTQSNEQNEATTGED